MRSRLRDLMLANSMAEKDLERERVKAQRDANNMRTTVDALRSLVPVAADAYGAYEKHVSDDAALEGAALVNEHLTETGDNDEAPEAMASRLVSERASLAAPEDDGKPRSWLRNLVDDPLGAKGRARKSAAVNAQGALAKQIQGNRLAANKITREDAEAEAKRAHEIAMQAARNAGKANDALAFGDDDENEAARNADPEREDVLRGVRASSTAAGLAEAERERPGDVKAATEATKREERRLQMLARIAADPKKRGVLDQDAWDDLATIGITKPAPSTSTGPKLLTDAQRKAKALADAAEARARSAKVKADNDENPSQKPPDTKERGKQRAIAAAQHLLDEIEAAHKDYKSSTSLPATGRGVGFVRGNFTGVLPGMEESKRARFLANSEGLNAMLFPILGREDAPADSETKRLAPLRIDENTTDAELEAKIATLRGMIAAQSHALNMGAAANASASAQSDTITVTNGRVRKRVSRARWAAEPVDGWEVVQ